MDPWSLWMIIAFEMLHVIMLINRYTAWAVWTLAWQGLRAGNTKATSGHLGQVVDTGCHSPTVLGFIQALPSLHFLVQQYQDTNSYQGKSFHQTHPDFTLSSATDLPKELEKVTCLAWVCDFIHQWKLILYTTHRIARVTEQNNVHKADQDPRLQVPLVYSGGRDKKGREAGGLKLGREGSHGRVHC